MQKIKLALLGMADNQNTADCIQYFDKVGRPFDLIILQKPNGRANLKRAYRKLINYGLVALVKRIWYGLFKDNSQVVADNLSRVQIFSDIRGPTLTKLLKVEKVDLLVVFSDQILPHKVLSKLRLGALNIHPGRLPAYRGLGAILRQAKLENRASLTAHFIDEGVDTGPILEIKDISSILAFELGSEGFFNELQHEKRKFCYEIVSRFELNPSYTKSLEDYVDTFSEQSSLSL